MKITKTIPHPYKKGEQWNVYKFEVTRKIIIEADPCMSDYEISALAQRCHDKEIGLEIWSGKYKVSLSPTENKK